VTANIAFSLAAAVVSLAIVVLAGLKGDWAVAAVYVALVLGFLARASFGRGARAAASSSPASDGRDHEPADGPEHEPVQRTGGPAHEPERRLKSARFRRR
jgi:hypothetical protein